MVAVAHAAGHLHLGHVEVPGACVQLREFLLVVLAEVAAEGSSASPDSCPSLRRLSATRLPIMPYISFHFWLERMNSAPLACDSRREKSIGTMDWCRSFETFESKNSIYFLPQPRFCMPGGVDLLMLYFISICLSYSLV